ncbi:hypothetical protein HN011_010203 [Eciton burchellii]|nr:hypothetical protein HN011_010203 [Eciton burchellii]
MNSRTHCRSVDRESTKCPDSPSPRKDLIRTPLFRRGRDRLASAGRGAAARARRDNKGHRRGQVNTPDAGWGGEHGWDRMKSTEGQRNVRRGSETGTRCEVMTRLTVASAWPGNRLPIDIIQGIRVIGLSASQSPVPVRLFRQRNAVP